MIYLLVMVGLWLLLAGWLRWSESRMIYYPTRGIETTPSQRGVPYEEVNLRASDGVRINGWFVPALHASQAAPSAPGAAAPVTILFFHGNAGNISHRFEKMAVFRDLGADLFLIDYRGYGRSEGRPDEPGTYRDARAAYEYLTRQRGIAPRNIVVYGESLGSAIAVDLASHLLVGGVVIEEAFTSIADVGQKMFPFLPVRLLVRNRYDTLRKIGRIGAPLLILHSRDDEYFPMRHAERLLAAAAAPKRLVELRGSHNDAFLASAASYRAAVREFLESVAGTPR